MKDHKQQDSPRSKKGRRKQVRERGVNEREREGGKETRKTVEPASEATVDGEQTEPATAFFCQYRLILALRPSFFVAIQSRKETGFILVFFI